MLTEVFPLCSQTVPGLFPVATSENSGHGGLFPVSRSTAIIYEDAAAVKGKLALFLVIRFH